MTEIEFILIVTSFLINSPTAAFAPNVTGSKGDQNEDVCNTEACKETATFFLNNMDQSADPCDDFYQYACGNFIKNTKIPESEPFIATFSTVRNEIEIELNQSLSSSINEKDHKALKLVKKFYQSCMDTEQIEKLELSEIKTKIKSLGGWPVVEGDAWDETRFDWLDVVRKSYQSRFKSKFLYDIHAITMKKKQVLTISKPSFFIDTVYLESNRNYTIEAAYLKLITAIAEAFGAKHDPNTANQMSEVWQFMKDLKKLPKASDDLVAHLSNFLKYYPTIPWRSYINSQMPENFTVPDNTYVRGNLGFLLGLESLLERTSKRIIANYVMTEVVLSIMTYLNEKVRAHYLDYSRAQIGVTKLPDRWKQCVQDAQEKLALAMSSVYVREYFSRERQPTNDVMDMFRHMKEALGEMIEQSNWMDDKSKVYALAKLENMGNNIGYPEVLDNKKPHEYYEKLELSVNSFVKEVDEYYEELEFSEESFVDIVLRVEKFISHKSVTEGFKDPRWKSFAENAQTVQAFYDVERNEIIIPAAIMNGVFYNKNRPKYINYGTLGKILGHEISHGFGPRSISRDKNGVTKPWMTDESKKIYNNRTKCIKEQYSDYLMKDAGMKINGGATLNENFADVVGTVVARGAYEKWVNEYGKEKKLPGLNRSPEEMFWLSYAVAACKKQRSLSLKNELVVRSLHSPSEARIITPFKNNPRFAKDFNCKVGSNMNPARKCTVF